MGLQALRAEEESTSECRLGVSSGCAAPALSSAGPRASAEVRSWDANGRQDLFEELFKPMEVEPEHVTALTCYTQLKEDYKDQVSDQVKWLRSSMEDRNESRSKKTAAFEKAVAAAEKESEHEAFDQIKQFRAVMKR
ncbi:unnamed protein product, partial [Prorocentrum cordatum]